MRYIIEFHPNENCVTLHFDQEFEEKYDTDPFMPSFIEQGEAPYMVELISQIHGVTKVRIDEFDLFIMKGDVFEWEEILPQAVQIVRLYHASDGTMTRTRPNRRCRYVGMSREFMGDSPEPTYDHNVVDPDADARLDKLIEEFDAIENSDDKDESVG